MRQAVIIDLDGTLCNTDHRQHFVTGGGDYGPKDFKKFYENLHKDLVNEWCLEIMTMNFRMRDRHIILVSGRPEEYRKQTVKWIMDWCGFHPDNYILHMRKTNDFRCDTVVKREIYEEHIKPEYEVLYCIDDRKKVVDMWRDLGLVCLQCAPGLF